MEPLWFSIIECDQEKYIHSTCHHNWTICYRAHSKENDIAFSDVTRPLKSNFNEGTNTDVLCIYL